MNDTVRNHSWGTEIVWAKRDQYCGKILVFPKANASTPMWLSSQGSCDWFVNAGSFTVTWIDTESGKIFQTELKEGDVFSCDTMKPAKLTSLVDNSSVTEVGNRDTDVKLLTEN